MTATTTDFSSASDAKALQRELASSKDIQAKTLDYHQSSAARSYLAGLEDNNRKLGRDRLSKTSSFLTTGATQGFIQLAVPKEMQDTGQAMIMAAKAADTVLQMIINSRENLRQKWKLIDAKYPGKPKDPNSPDDSLAKPDAMNATATDADAVKTGAPTIMSTDHGSAIATTGTPSLKAASAVMNFGGAGGTPLLGMNRPEIKFIAPPTPLLTGPAGNGA